MHLRTHAFIHIDLLIGSGSATEPQAFLVEQEASYNYGLLNALKEKGIHDIHIIYPGETSIKRAVIKGSQFQTQYNDKFQEKIKSNLEKQKFIVHDPKYADKQLELPDHLESVIYLDIDRDRIKAIANKRDDEKMATTWLIVPVEEKYSSITYTAYREKVLKYIIEHKKRQLQHMQDALRQAITEIGGISNQAEPKQGSNKEEVSASLEFIQALEILEQQLIADIEKQSASGKSAEQVLKSPAVDMMQKTKKMLDELVLIINSAERYEKGAYSLEEAYKELFNNYERVCKKSPLWKTLGKAFLLVIATGLAFAAGFVAGTALGLSTGPAAPAIAAAAGTAAAAVVGTAVGYGLYGKNKQQKKVADVVKAGKNLHKK